MWRFVKLFVNSLNYIPKNAQVFLEKKKFAMKCFAETKLTTFLMFIFKTSSCLQSSLSECNFSLKSTHKQ